MVVPFIVVGCGDGDSASSSLSNNTTPSIDTAFSNLSIQENNGTTNYEINVSDSDGDSLTLSVESNDTSILTVTQNWTNPINQATYYSPLDFNLTTETNAIGNVKITLTLSDDESNTTTSLDVNVTEATFENSGIWKGVSYATVTSPYTGKVWLDRNLGASQVCTALNDTACYGDYYQWGRAADGHQESNSTTTATLSTDINSSGSSFITNNDWVASGVDDNGSLRTANWSATDGSSVCPTGYRVPTITELAAETTAASTAVNNNTDAFDNFLKLPSAGSRSHNDGSMNNQGSSGIVWSSSVTGSYSNSLYFYSSSAYTYNIIRAGGHSVRCLKD